ncbi:Nif11-like leader peptide family natural product precursor [Candidatus Contubernalis alkaliaceticus]|uniref:Nif11-like leader peptide family natural product precursor n=1 Tax=Candidatus Contubernalis alkaliaceticus TaxID=338645 RepID=UPI001F4BD721|nr:Nif11-like leader peptide family natural product precursor [Candidatus Contubernalis alkalaceticus]
MAFPERMKTDQEFARKVIACKDKEERMAMVKAEGFDFSSEELSEFKDSVLSDEDLSRIVGGEDTACKIYIYNPVNGCTELRYPPGHSQFG